MQSSIDLTAAGVHCDSFCPDSTYPVVLHSMSNNADGQATRGKLTPAVCAISLQVTLGQFVMTTLADHAERSCE